MSKVYFGIDLGTSRSSISYVVDNPRAGQGVYLEPETVKFSPPPGATAYHHLQRYPSVIYLERKQKKLKIISGFEADAAASGKLAKPFESLFASAKSDMGTLRIYEDSISPDISTPKEVSAEIIRQLIRAAEKETGISPKNCNVVITVPASFMHNQRKDTLEAAKMAGLNIDEGDLLDEPIAAFIHMACHQKLDARLDMKTSKKILMFDLGAGTCDISLFEAAYDIEQLQSGVGLQIKNRAISNYKKLGGDNIDLHIVEEELLPAFCEKNGIDFKTLKEKTKREVRFRLKAVAKLLKESLCRQLDTHRTTKEVRQSWAIDSMVISSFDERTKKVHGNMSLKRFMELMEPFVTDDLESSYKVADDYYTFSFFGPVVNALRKAGLRMADIDGFIFNGGSCHNPVIKKAFSGYYQLSHANFFETPDLDRSVSQGAAIHCYHRHKNERIIVAPIVNTEIGIYTYGLKREALVKAGAELPFPHEGYFINDNFCVPKDNLDSVGISIYADDGRVISNLRLALPPHTAKGEPISIGISIDRNKVMSFTAALKNAPDSKMKVEISHPWTHNVNTPEDMDVGRCWEQIAEMRMKGSSVPHDKLIDLSIKERLRGNSTAALEILQRLEDKGIQTARINNAIALAYGDLDEEEKALEYFKRAVELEPRNAVMLANYGSQLVMCGQVTEAIPKLRESIDIDPDEYIAYNWLGHAYRHIGEEDNARQEFKKAQQLLRAVSSRYPDNDWYLKYMEGVHRALGEYDEADRARKQQQNARNTRLLNGSPEALVAGPDSGIWEEADLFENK
ncbi:MAG: Hsp70 family protein [Nitrospirae bacterium]|nr:Hsp70 family protein [Nitrospirota bacterium]